MQKSSMSSARFFFEIKFNPAQNILYTTILRKMGVMEDKEVEFDDTTYISPVEFIERELTQSKDKDQEIVVMLTLQQKNEFDKYIAANRSAERQMREEQYKLPQFQKRRRRR